MEDTYDNAPDEEDPELAKLYACLEGTAQDIQLATKADTVQIIITRHDYKTGETHSFGAGRGNIYARTEACDNFVQRKRNS